MSAHTNDKDPIITLSNYEEYLLLYVDNELEPQERALVEAFLQFHPELQPELDLLMGTLLTPETLSFEDKESLLAQNISAQNIDEDLLLYVDDELAGGAKKSMEEKLQQDKAMQQQYQWLLRTKSDPSEVVLYPNKEELYRHTVRRIGAGFVLRIAAAVLLIASMGVLYLQEQKDTAPAVANIPEKRTKPEGGAKRDDSTVDNAIAKTIDKSREQKEQVVTSPDTNTGNDAFIAAAQPARSAAKKKRPETPTKEILTLKTAGAQESKVALAYEQVPIPRKKVADVQALAPQQKEPEATVTSNTPLAYNNSEAPAEPAFAVNKEEDGRNKGNLKSLLRRATRLVERRTGISTTNEDEELLIGVVALKLK